MGCPFWLRQLDIQPLLSLTLALTPFSREYDLYLKLRHKVSAAREAKKYDLAEALLLQMEQLWWKIPRDEQELLETCPAEAVDQKDPEQKA
jgi:hypothetical protein